MKFLKITSALLLVAMQAGVACAGTLINEGQNKFARWSNNLMPYEFDAGVPDSIKNVVAGGILHIQKNSAFRFVLRDASNAALYPKYVKITATVSVVPGDGKGGCKASLGAPYFAGFQTVQLEPTVASGCQSIPTAAHELMHAIGFLHEQSRPDRNQYVNVNYDNICTEVWCDSSNWRIDTNAVRTPEYDFKSLMHYGAAQFAKPGTVVITPLDPSKVIAPSDTITAIDKQAFDTFYPPYKVIARLPEKEVSVYVGSTVSYNATASFDPNGSSLTYNWDFKDGTLPENGLSIQQHTFNATGIFNVQLKATDSQNRTDVDTLKTTVYGAEVLAGKTAFLFL